CPVFAWTATRQHMASQAMQRPALRVIDRPAGEFWPASSSRGAIPSTSMGASASHGPRRRLRASSPVAYHTSDRASLRRSRRHEVLILEELLDLVFHALLLRRRDHLRMERHTPRLHAELLGDGHFRARALVHVHVLEEGEFPLKERDVRGVPAPDH